MRSLGPPPPPCDANGDVDGGTSSGHRVHSPEHHPIAQRWHLAAFTDAGNAFNTMNEFEPRHSAGLGVRLKPPPGPHSPRRSACH